MSFFIFIVGADTGSGHSCCIQMQTRDRSDGQRQGLGQGWGCILNTFFVELKHVFRENIAPWRQLQVTCQLSGSEAVAPNYVAEGKCF